MTSLLIRPLYSSHFSTSASVLPRRASTFCVASYPNPLKSPLQERLAFFPATFSFSPTLIHKSRLQSPRFVYDGISGGHHEKELQKSEEFENVATEAIYQKTLRLVECSMFAAVSGLLYYLSNSLSIENYFGCFFSLPIVISSLRWGVSAGRKTMVATAMLLLTLSGPVKASTYLLMHGLVGLTLGSLWRLGVPWGLSIFMCTSIRAVGLLGYVLISSFLIRENILALITINIHASLTYAFAALGLNTIPSMEAIYAIFGIVLVLNSVFFVFLLHMLYAVFLTKIGMKASLNLPKWLEKAI